MQKTLIQLKLIDANVAIGFGSLIETQDHVIFIGLALGKINYLNRDCMYFSFYLRFPEPLRECK